MKGALKSTIPGALVGDSKISNIYVSQRFIEYCSFIAELVFLNLVSILQSWKMVLWMVFMFSFIPTVLARGKERPFPDLSFREFSDFILENFSSRISLSTVLIILFSITENTQLLSLHAHQQKARYKEERSTTSTAWIRALTHPLRKRIEQNGQHILKHHDSDPDMTDEQLTIAVAMRVDGLSKLLKLYPYDEAGQFTGKLNPVCHQDIEPIHVICPDAVVCETTTCKPCSLIMTTKPRDIPYTTLIKDFAIYENVPVLAGHCDTCKTTYYADHE